MSRPTRTRGWAFVHPDFDAPVGPDGCASGLALKGSGALAMVSGDAAVRQSLLLLLSTMPGERVMRPEYGCDLHRLMFSTNDETTAGLAIHYVRQAVARWEPRIKILSIDARRAVEDPGRLDLFLEYRRRDDGAPQELALGLNLQGGSDA